MKGKHLQKLLLVAVLSSFLLLQVPPPGASQDYVGKVLSESDDEMIGLGEYSGGGHMTVTVTGEQATALRRRIIYMFDEYPSIPTGFTGATYTGSPNGNGVLDESEIAHYSLWVQRYLWERQGQGGTPYHFSRMTKVELLEGDDASGSGVPLSTEGLVGTDVNTDAPIVLKHIFNLESTAQHRTFDLSDNLTVSALYEGFSFHRAHDFNDTTFGPFSVAGEPTTTNWILRDNPYYPGNDALWHGSSPTPEYENDISATTYADFDLRFAVEAAMRFDLVGHLGRGDALRIQVKEEGGSYTNLQSFGENNDYDTFQTFVFDLDNYIGTKVRVNFNFTSDNSQNDTGYYIDNFDINAPCAYIGEMEIHHTDYIVGGLSFTGFEKDRGSTHLIRTPAGMILTWSTSFNSTTPSGDRATFVTFDILDNPQILFGLIFVCAYLMSHFQNRYYNDYRRAYSMVHREGWYKKRWLHALGLLGIILYIIFYFFPSLFVLAGANFYMNGAFMWAFCIVYLVLIIIVTKFIYMKAEDMIPPPVPKEEEISVVVEAPEEYDELPPPVDMGLAVPCSVCLEDLHDVADEGIKCTCGQVFHKDCAAKAERCPNCNRLLEVTRPKETRMVTVKCPACGNTVLVEGDADLLRTHCESCGSILQEVALGYNYLIVDDDPSVAYEEFKSILKKDIPSLCISTTFPDKLMKEFDVEGTDLFWLSDTATDPSVKTLDPKRLDFEMMRAISNFLKDFPKGVVMIDGVEYLTVENGFERVLRFVKKINDLASVSDATIIIPVGPAALGKDEFAMLKKEFDKVQVLTTAPLEE